MLLRLCVVWCGVWWWCEVWWGVGSCCAARCVALGAWCRCVLRGAARSCDEAVRDGRWDGGGTGRRKEEGGVSKRKARHTVVEEEGRRTERKEKKKPYLCHLRPSKLEHTPPPSGTIRHQEAPAPARRHQGLSHQHPASHHPHHQRSTLHPPNQ